MTCEEERTVIANHLFDNVYSRPKDVHSKVKVKPAVIEEEKKFTAQAVAALQWMKFCGRVHVRGVNIDVLIEERVRGLKVLGVEDVYELLVNTRYRLITNQSLRREEVEKFWQDRTF